MARCPTDPTCRIECLRVRVSGTDCVAELQVDSRSWDTFADLFAPIGDKTPWSKAWISDAGEWKVVIQRDDDARHTIVSELDSLLDYHPWKLTTHFYLSGDRLVETGDAIREFLGQT